MKFEKNPDKTYRSLPFWSLNGKLDEKELRAQIGTLKEMGFGGVFIHSRTGLATEYMGEEWLRLVEACADECNKQGMDAWLYDEDRWPSGTCGGYVTEDPNYRLRFISAQIVEAQDFDLHPYGDEFLAAFAVKLTGQGYTKHPENMPRYAGMKLADYFPVHNRHEIPDGYLGMICKVELMQCDEFYNDFTYVDTMNREATERFLDLTHRKYKAHFGENLSTAVKGIFTDEPHRGALLSGFGVPNADRLYMLPFTGELPEAYAAIWEEDIFDYLPELYFATDGDDFSRVMWQYVEVLQQLFLENFAIPVNEWCKRSGIILTGHILHEDTLSAQTTMSGSVMRYYEHMGYPGLDNLGSQNTCYQAAIAVTSAAKQTGKSHVLSELYGCTGWKTTFLEYKQMGDWQAAMGVNLRCPHLSWYTMQGEAKRDYPASISKQANWHKEYRAVEDYFARLGNTLSKAKSLTDTLVVMPVESAWGLTHMGTYVNSFAVRDDTYQKLEDDFRALTESLVYAGVDFDYGDEDMMCRLGKVSTDEKGAYVQVGKMKYRRLVLPFMVNVRSTTLALAADFAEAGGSVTVCGAMPTHVDGHKAEITVKLPVVQTSKAADALKTDNLLHIESDGQFFGTLKKAGKNEYVYFTVNASRNKSAHAKIVLRGTYNAEKFNLRNGETEGICFAHENGNTVVTYDFDKSEELLLHFTDKKAAAYAPAPTANAFDLGAPVAYKLDSDNVLVLDRARAYVDGAYFGEEELLRLDRMLREKFGLRYRGGSMVQPWYKEKFFGAGYAQKQCRLALEFDFDVDYVPENAKFMAENTGKIAVSLNGKPLTGKAEASAIDVCFGCVAIDKSLFAKGRNTLRVECDFSDAFDIENCYILGAFGVVAGVPCRITALPDTLALGDITGQGLPFYAGSVQYVFAAENAKYQVCVPDYYGACIKSGEEICAFAPNTLTAQATDGKLEITVVLTPKNMFGPLHELPALMDICGPENYHTDGEHWTDGYAFIPQGILGGVKVKKL